MRKSHVTTILMLALALSMIITSSAWANGNKLGGVGGNHQPPSGSGGSGCTSGCGPPPPSGPPAPYCSWTTNGSTTTLGSGSLTKVFIQYVLTCSPSCTEAGGSVSCPFPPPNSSCIVTGAGIGAGKTIFCPDTSSSSSTSTAGYGYGASPGDACISQWQITYEGQSYSNTPAGCSQTITTSPTQFRQVCTNSSTMATVQFWIHLPSIQPPTGYYTDAGANQYAPHPWYPFTQTPSDMIGLSASNITDAPNATLGPYTVQEQIPPCPVYNGKSWATKYVMNKLDAGNTTGVGPSGCTVCSIHPLVHGATTGNGMWLSSDGSLHRFVFGWHLALPQGAPTVGIDPYLQWQGGTARIANYAAYHSMWGVFPPTYGLHFSTATPGSGSEAACNGYLPSQNVHGSAGATDGRYSPWFLVSQWDYWPSRTAVWQAACHTPKIVIDFATHIPTVQGNPMLLQLTGMMKAAWFYNHFGLTVTAAFTQPQGQTTFQVPPWEETSNSSSCTTSFSKQPVSSSSSTSASGNQTTTITVSSTPANGGGFNVATCTSTSTLLVLNNTLPFLYPAGVTATISSTGFVPGPVHQTAAFPVHATAHISAVYAHVVCCT